MALLGVQSVSPRSKPREEDSLDKILKGLQIAQGVYGITSNIQKAELMAQQAKTAQAQEQRMAAREERTIEQERAAMARAEAKEARETEAFPAQQAALALQRQRKGRLEEAQIQQAELGVEQAKQKLAEASKPVELGGLPPKLAKKVEKLKVEEKKSFDKVVMGLKSVRDMDDALKRGVNTFSVVGDNDFTIASRNWKEAIGRLQSGGAINAEEAESFLGMAPGMFDSSDIQQKKLVMMQDEMTSRLRTLGFAPTDVQVLVGPVQGQKPVEGVGGLQEAIAAPKDLPFNPDMYLGGL